MSEERIGVRRSSYLGMNNPHEDILKLLDGLEDLADNAYQVMGKVWGINSDEFQMYTNKIRASLPDEMRRASRVANDSDKIVASAEDEAALITRKATENANKIVEEARQMAAKLIDNSEINRLAKTQAQEIISGAESSAREIRRGADEYAKEVLVGMENHLAKVLGALQKGREKLDTRLSTTHQGEELLIPAGRGVRR